MDSAPVENGGDYSFTALLEVVASRLAVEVRDINTDRDARYRGLHSQKLDCMGRATKRLEILEDVASRKIRAWVEIYKDVAAKYHSEEMLSSAALKGLSDEIAASVKLACQSVKEMSESDCRTCGEWDQSAIEALASYYPTVEAKLVAFASTELRVLEAERKLVEQAAVKADRSRNVMMDLSGDIVEPKDTTNTLCVEPGKRGTEVVAKQRQRGPTRDYKTASQVAEVVSRVAPDGDWRSKLDEICEALDENKVRPPKWRDRACKGWSGCLERALVVKAVEYRLKVARDQETFS
jgi:hypothetical protein